jgi:hypothetical protein
LNIAFYFYFKKVQNNLKFMSHVTIPHEVLLDEIIDCISTQDLGAVALTSKEMMMYCDHRVKTIRYPKYKQGELPRRWPNVEKALNYPRELLPDLIYMKNLKYLDIPIIMQDDLELICMNLTTLTYLDTAMGAADISPLSLLVNLNELHMTNCIFVKSLNPLITLTNLETLTAKGVSAVKNYKPLCAMHSLKYLTIDRPYYHTVKHLGMIKGLISLDLTGGELDSNMGHLSTLTNLQALHLNAHMGTGGAKGLSKLTALTELSFLPQLDTVNQAMALSSLTRLVKLTMNACELLKWCLPTLTCLTELTLFVYGDFNVLNPVTTLASGLQSLHVHANDNGEQTTTLEPLSALTMLKSLTLDEYTELTTVEPLASLTGLKLLCIKDCPALTNLEPLRALPNLK